MTDSATEALEAVLAAERRGELLTAHDLATRALVAHPDDPRLRYRSVLLLARAGSTARALARFTELGLDHEQDEDVSALRARLEKDVALSGPAAELPQSARRAAERYLAVARQTGGRYSLVNAATLLLLAGDPAASAELAAEVLERPDDGDYWSAATAAEAHLLKGQDGEAAAALRSASERAGNDWSAVATTRRQLRAICKARGSEEAVLRALAAPGVVHFCGHRVEALPAGAERAVVELIAAELDRQRVDVAFGSLANGADILWSEAVLERGGEVHVVLPFAREGFLAASVGPDWAARFDAVLERATSISYVTRDALRPDEVLFAAASEQAMGMALLRGRWLEADLRQVAVWDGRPSKGAAGTGIDVERWRRTGHETVVITPPRQPPPERPPERQPRSSRSVRGLVFADVAHYSGLTDEQLPDFDELLRATWYETLERLGDAVLLVETWGDALFVVLSDVVSGARCALELQQGFAETPFHERDLPVLGLRVAGHVGPVFSVVDRLTGRTAVSGSHVNLAARIEPITPVGEAYVTEPFAAALELSADHSLRCEYVGDLPMAKGYGNLRMHRLLS